MKRWRFLALAVMAVMLWCGVASAERLALPRPVDITTHNGMVYTLESLGTPGFPTDWFPSQIVELDENLVVQRTLKLESGQSAALSSQQFALHNGKLFVGNIGGAVGGGEAGDVWEVDIAAWTARKVFAAGSGRGVFGLVIANDGTAFLLVGGYDDSWLFSGQLFVTTADNLSAGNIGTGIPISATGFTWGIAWSEADETLWVMAGNELQARNRNGVYIRTFMPSELGANIGSIAPLDGGGLIYTATDFATTSVGRITRVGSVYTVFPNQNVGLGGDVAVFAFRDNNNNERILVRENNFGVTQDFVSIFDPSNLGSPMPNLNFSNWGFNIRAVTTLGNILFFSTYERHEIGNELPGEIRRVNMASGFVLDENNYYRPDSVVVPDEADQTHGGGSSGCNSGFGLIALLLVAGLSLLKTRRK